MSLDCDKEKKSNTSTTQPTSKKPTGSLRAEGLIGGVVVARDTARAPGTAAGIKLIADPPVIEANGGDISRIEAYIVDANGTWIPTTTTTNAVTFSLSSGSVADGTLIGDFPISAQAGACVVLARAGLTTGTMTVQATGAGLSTASAVVTVKSSDIVGISEKLGGRSMALPQGFRWIKVVGDRLTLSARKNVKTSIALYDVSGKLLKSGVVGKRNINLKKDFGLSSGVYFVRLDRM